MNWDVKYFPEYWGGKKLAYPHVPAEAPKFARTIVVGNLIFVSGCTGQDTLHGGPTPTTFEGQMEIALEKMKVAMEEAGSSLNNVVKTLMLLRDVEDYSKMRKVETEYYLKHAPYLAENPPASTFLQAASLAKPNFLVEIDAIGVISQDMPGWEVKYYPEFWDGKKLAYPHVPIEFPKFARTEVVGNLVMVSGCTGQDTITNGPTPTTLEGQMNMALQKMKIAMEETGSSLDNVVKTLIMLKDVKDYGQMRKLETEFYQEHAPYLVENPPASTFLQPAGLAKPEFLVEIDAFGVVSKDAPGAEVKYIPEYWDGKKLAYPHVPLEYPKFAKTEVMGNLVFVSGCTGQDTITNGPTPTTLEGQMILAMEKMKLAMEASGSSLDKVVKTLIMLKNVEDYGEMRKLEVEYFQKHAPYLVENPPASTFVKPAALAKPEFLVEIDAFGIL